MATIQVYVEEQNRNYNVTVNLVNGVLDDGTGDSIYYLTLSTTLTYPDGTRFPTYVIQDLTDTPPGYGAAATFTELVNDYIGYFLVQGEVGQSSSSSSTSESSSSWQYSSSTSSSSSSSSSGGTSSSSSTSLSSSSSSTSESSSSSSTSESSSSSSTSESSSSSSS